MYERVARLPRVWSNRELAAVAPLLSGDVVNVSAWRDEDKQGRHYRDYFPRATSYSVTNYKAEARGFQGADNEIFLDLTEPVPDELKGRFDVVFNHTTLEHVYEVHAAFRNLCEMSRDAVVIVLPFLQEQHGEYGDFWRFSPDCVARLFRDNGFTPIHVTANRHLWSSVYVFALAVRDPSKYARENLRVDTLEASLQAGRRARFAGLNSLPPWTALRRWLREWRKGWL